MLFPANYDGVIAFGGRLRLANRTALAVAQTVSVPVGVTQNIFINPAPSFTVNSDQAFRIVGLTGSVNDPNVTGKLSLDAFQIFIATNLATIGKFQPTAYPVNYPTGVLGAIGANLWVPETPLWSANDYLTQAAGPIHTVAVACSADISNGDTVAHDAGLYVAFVAEVFDVRNLEEFTRPRK